MFDKLKKDKQDKIMHACIQEFANKGYDLASTNLIAKKAGVAKGSLFKYFGTKENLFFAVASHVLTEYRLYMSSRVEKMPPDILQRFILIQDMIYDFFGSNVDMFRFFKRVLTERGGAIHIKLREKWEPLTQPIFMEFVQGADLSKLKVSVPELIQIISWVDMAIDSDIMESITPETTIAEMKALYREKIGLVYKVLKKGIYK